MADASQVDPGDHYDLIGHGYSVQRVADPRIRAMLDQELAGLRSVINIGAGTGSYEPKTTTVAVEPSIVMIRQRPEWSAPVLQASAESVPLPDDVAEGALAVLTVHHWGDLRAGLLELRRLASRRVVILTFEPAITAEFWLLKDYFPQLADAERSRECTTARIIENLGAPAQTQVRPVPIPWDCADGFAAAFWRRPEAYLDPAVRTSMSVLADLSEQDEGLVRLHDDLETGAWAARHHDLVQLEELDLGYRLLTTDLEPTPRRSADSAHTW